jgi:hypothetical protein
MHHDNRKQDRRQLFSQRPRKKLLLLLAGISAWLVMAPLAGADDINPPDYRTDPHSAVVFWQEQTPGQGDLVMNGFNAYPGQYARTAFGGGVPALDIVHESESDRYHFYMPNFVDPLPQKLMRIQVTYSNPEPFVAGMQIFDPIIGVIAQPVANVSGTPNNPAADGYFYEDWEIAPNPDYEIVDIYVPTGSLLHQVVIDTVSLPEPATMTLLAVGALAMIRRRRK